MRGARFVGAACVGWLLAAAAPAAAQSPPPLPPPVPAPVPAVPTPSAVPGPAVDPALVPPAVPGVVGPTAPAVPAPLVPGVPGAVPALPGQVPPVPPGGGLRQEVLDRPPATGESLEDFMARENLDRIVMVGAIVVFGLVALIVTRIQRRRSGG